MVQVYGEFRISRWLGDSTSATLDKPIFNNKNDIMPPWSFSYYSARVERGVAGWPSSVRADYLRILDMMARYGPNLGLPHTRAMGGGLFEIRAKGREGIGRALFCTVVGKRIVILHCFIKKTEQTPKQELGVAMARQKEVLKHGP
ncbi:type II toxin-antitoxin system RelE/ParE family toxin [Solilutibacter silvestris]|uniref:Phage derived protein Gp49-like n=1 Tax=Solilutibacter silvestris TaxID=1645665 RepID=A0A2K1Q2W4_9GAMM|nr:type II toxin-antitoxin system RelE/ParE family toxin [Lysobacter silvestris]PNS09297.1 Phage derived protein Gp49-like [Lysobacter silvestris]